jgi:hypothetical protein
MNTYKLTDENKKSEYHTIEQIVTNNGYNASIVKQLARPNSKQNLKMTKAFGQRRK